jgi:aryl-alcohol dehydrogenase-like predicted oxidoreductase
MEIAIDGVPLFGCVQSTWNLLEPSAGPALAAAHAAGLGVIIKEGLANGRLTTRNTDAAFAPKRLVLERTATRLGTSLDALCLAAIMAQPWPDVVLSGAATADQIRSNAAALTVPRDDRAAEMLGTLAQEPEAYWSARARLRWN